MNKFLQKLHKGFKMSEKILTVEELDDLEHYKIIADEKELKWFYDHCVHPLKRNEAYAFCLASRHKKLTDEERKGTGLGRSEMLDPILLMNVGRKVSVHTNVIRKHLQLRKVYHSLQRLWYVTST